MNKHLIRVCCGLVVALMGRGVYADCVDEPPDYRISDFRAPIPCTLSGGRVVTLADMQDLIADGRAILIDVLPAPRRPRKLPEGTVWSPKERHNIPGSVWLSNTGFGELPVEEEDYFRHHLNRLTCGDFDHPLVFYCLADCWMSWNAAKRAIAWGYAGVAWFPEGTDAWKQAGLPLEASAPVPLPFPD